MKDGRMVRGQHKGHTVTEWNTDRLSIERKRTLYTEAYQGSVYCATVPNGLLVTRRNGTVLISGNSCTAQAGIGIMEYSERKAFGRHLDLSRLYVYKMTRNLMKLTGDTGGYLRATMGALRLCGAPPEEYWPYEVNKYDEEPPAFVHALAQNFQAARYLRLDQDSLDPAALLTRIKTYLAAKLPAMFGFTVYNSIREAATTGKIPFPVAGDQVAGGHAVVACGYDDDLEIGGKNKTTGALLIRNSWGTKWGQQGYGWLPYDYVLRGLAIDWWVVLKREWVDTKEFGL
jgi:C1A family cysteine protease